jgi:hypothetical protein
VSRDLFLRSGKHLGAVGEKAHVIPNWWVRLYDIGEEQWVGAEYPDKARQVQPIAWQPRKVLDEIRANQERRAQAVAQRPRLKFSPSSDQSLVRPSLKRSAPVDVEPQRPALKKPVMKPKLKPRH